MAFDFEKLRGILVCPRSRRELILEHDALISTSPEVRLKFPIVDGIPRLLIDEAEQLSLESWSEVMRRAGRDERTGALIS